MNVLCVGGGPAGLYFALLHKKAHPTHRVTVVEQNAAGVTYGWGVVFSAAALEFLREGDVSFMDALIARLARWDDLTLVHGNEVITLDGYGFTSIARLELLRLLQAQCGEAGVDLRFSEQIDTVRLEDHDLVVASDGVHSAVRRQFSHWFHPSITELGNKYAWYGTTRAFETLSLVFREFQGGHYVAHAYRFNPTTSTFIVECDTQTWQRAGLDTMSEEASRQHCARVFARELGGEPLLSNRSTWGSFPVLSNRYWRHENVVLLGDALRTVHFSIGSGTRLALEDAIALHEAVDAGSNVRESLELFEMRRRPVVEKLLRAAENSYRWYENFPVHMRQSPLDFAMSYVTRSGRVTRAHLERDSPRFLEQYDAWKGQVSS